MADTKDWGALDPKVHEQFVKRIDHWARVAGIPKQYIYEPLATNCSEKEVAWVKNYYKILKAGKGGLVYEGRFKGSPMRRLMAMTGCLMRNFIDARFVMVDTILEDDYPICGVYVIPNFTSGEGYGYEWKQSKMLGFLSNALARQRPVIMTIPDREKFEKIWGAEVLDLIDAHYYVLEPHEVLETTNPH